MIKQILAANEFLDGYVLNAQLSKLAGISKNAYTFWRDVHAARYRGGRAIFLLASSLPDKYAHLGKKCSDLGGLVLASAFCEFSGLAPSHLVCGNKSSMFKLLDIQIICGFKFVNLKKFYDDLGLSYDKQIYIEKSKFFSPSPLERQIRLTPTLSLGYY